MKKKIWALFLLVGLLASMHVTAYAETAYGGSDWSVVFTNDKRMDSNFKSQDMSDVIYGMQPGDKAVITLSLKNSNSEPTDWYLRNEVLYSLEDRSANSGTSGGAYTYKLVFEGPAGARTLFDSDAIGGENDSPAGAGLHQATRGMEDKDEAKQWLFLDSLANGQSGKVTLEVALDGDTQGNDYQDTLADLRMRFAVEMSAAGNRGTTPNAPANPRTMVRTGDETDLTPYILLACASGGVLMAFAAYTQISRSRERKGGLES